MLAAYLAPHFHSTAVAHMLVYPHRVSLVIVVFLDCHVSFVMSFVEDGSAGFQVIWSYGSAC